MLACLYNRTTVSVRRGARTDTFLTTLVTGDSPGHSATVHLLHLLTTGGSRSMQGMVRSVNDRLFNPQTITL